MKGFFISISTNRNVVFVYSIEYSVIDRPVKLSGLWEPTKLIEQENHYELICKPGYHLSIKKIDNVYLRKFAQKVEVSRNGWQQGKNFPYKVTRYKDDRMFLLLSSNLSIYPVDVEMKNIKEALRRSGVSDDAKIIYL